MCECGRWTGGDEFDKCVRCREGDAAEWVEVRPARGRARGAAAAAAAVAVTPAPPTPVRARRRPRDGLPSHLVLPRQYGGQGRGSLFFD